MVIGDALLDHGGEFLPTHGALLGRERKRLALRQFIGQTAGDVFRIAAAGREDEERREI